jgi:hypothetical protein
LRELSGGEITERNIVASALNLPMEARDARAGSPA